MVLVYVGYLVFNVLIGEMRGWLMGQGYCVAVIEVLNLLIGNQYFEQVVRYVRDEVGMSCLVVFLQLCLGS